MKNVNFKITALLLAILSIATVSCKDDDDDEKPIDIVGTWVSGKVNYTTYVDDKVYEENEDETDAYSLKFNKDNTGLVIAENEPFTWTLTGKTITLHGTDDEAISLTFTIESQSAKTMVLQNEEKGTTDGHTYRVVYVINLTKQ